MNKLVSVIIPIYNVKGFIDRGIRQILNQTYQNIEILLVDDGSTDGSYEVCQRCASQNDRILVLHQSNKGSGSARNLGLDYAKGSYIYFFDIDDEVSPNLLEYNVRMMNQLSVDVIVFGYHSIDVKYKTQVSVTFPQTHIESNLQLRDVYVDQFVLKENGFVWNKFYNKEFLDRHHLRFENQRIQQDEVFNILCYQHVEKMFVSSEVLYTYYVYHKGNTRSYYISDRFDIYKSVRKHFENIKSFWGVDDQRLDEYLNERFYYDGVLSCILFNLMHTNCPLSQKLKKEVLNTIMSDSYTLEAFEYADGANLGLEQQLYKNACKKQSLWQIKFWVGLFSFLRTINVRLRRIL